MEYVDLESFNGLNLYAYCGNDPVNYVDPSGHFIVSILIIGAIVGASIGFGTAAYVDYQDDGQIFNGSVEWYDYLGATVLGGAAGVAIGAGIGYIAPYIGSALSSFSSATFTFGGGITLSTNGAATMATGFTITGVQILQGTGTLTLANSLMLMAKDPFIKHLSKGMNERQKEMFQREIEGLKKGVGRGGNDNLDKNILREIAEWIKSMFK